MITQDEINHFTSMYAEINERINFIFEQRHKSGKYKNSWLESWSITNSGLIKLKISTISWGNTETDSDYLEPDDLLNLEQIIEGERIYAKIQAEYDKKAKLEKEKNDKQEQEEIERKEFERLSKKFGKK